MKHTAAVKLTAEQASAYRREGFLIVEDLLHEEEVARSLSTRKRAPRR